MECLDTISSLRINFKKNINTVVIVVEGAEYEFKLFKHIFLKVLHYTYIEKSRNQSKFREYNEFVMKGNENSKIIVINTKNSNIGSIEDDENYRNELYKLLYLKYGIDIKNVPVYYVWDRDRGSNDITKVTNLISKLGNAYENEDYQNGLLLLSYPCCEAYTISNFESVKYLSTNIKQYVKEKHLRISDINKHTLLKAVIDMHNKLLGLGILKYDLSKFGKINLKILNLEEKIYNQNKTYILLSLISLILLDLGIISYRDYE